MSLNFFCYRHVKRRSYGNENSRRLSSLCVISRPAIVSTSSKHLVNTHTSTTTFQPVSLSVCLQNCKSWPAPARPVGRALHPLFYWRSAAADEEAVCAMANVLDDDGDDAAGMRQRELLQRLRAWQGECFETGAGHMSQQSTTDERPPARLVSVMRTQWADFS